MRENEKRFYFKGDINRATLRYENGKFVLSKGSIINEPRESLKNGNISLYEEAQSIYKNNLDDEKKLVRDMEFLSPSRAGAIVYGTSFNGQEGWIDSDGNTIKSYFNDIKDKRNIVNDFLDFHFENKETLLKDDFNVNFARYQKEFIEGFPLEALAEMNIEEYALGTEYSKDSLCYNLEFGKYAYLGFGIGGGSSHKLGIYFSNGKYRYRGNIVENVESFWADFRKQLYEYLNQLNESAEAIENQNYPLLVGMPMFINKLAFLYNPEKFICIGKRQTIVDLLKMFDYDYNKNFTTAQLSFVLNKQIRTEIPELANECPSLIGGTLRNYLKMIDDSEAEEIINETKYWLIAPGENARLWEQFYSEKVIAIGWNKLGDLSKYSSKEEIKEALVNNYEKYQASGSNSNTILANYEFANEMKIGDIVYAKKEKTTIVGRGIIESDYYFDDNQKEYKSCRRVRWTHNKSIDHQAAKVTKTLTNITKRKDYISELERLFNAETIVDRGYNRKNFLDDVFMEEELYTKIINTLGRKKNIIIQGSPGVGKTYCAKKLFYSMIESEDESKVRMVQFHQSYSYEDFIQGYKPNESGAFVLKDGLFYNLVSEAREEYETAKLEGKVYKDYCIVIDEINRGNLSKIFGELMMLIESDKRKKEWEVNLTYSDDSFYIPENLYIIGTMNTADRSLATIDYALRRRFAFFNLEPAFGNEKFREYLINEENVPEHTANEICNKFINLNDYIVSTLGENFVIGHSYFINSFREADDIMDVYDDIVEYEIKPLLEEYYFDEKEKVEEALSKIKM